MRKLKNIGKITGIVVGTLLFLYSIIGTSYNVPYIKEKAPSDIKSKGFTILRGESYEFGSWGHNGGKVWYHVCETAHPEIRYRIFITSWFGQLQYTYGSPEVLNRINVDLQNKLDTIK
jgi:hypothetical protein